MLEVAEEFRRRGIGEALEKHLINRMLERGWVPFCQVFTDNEASVRLQEKLKLRIGREKVYWISSFLLAFTGMIWYIINVAIMRWSSVTGKCIKNIQEIRRKSNERHY